MVVIEIYCDDCGVPSPDHALLGGRRDAQRIREALPELRRWLSLNHGWQFARGQDLCADCKIDPDALDFPAGWLRIPGRDDQEAELLSAPTGVGGSPPKAERAEGQS